LGRGTHEYQKMHRHGLENQLLSYEWSPVKVTFYKEDKKDEGCK